MQTDTTPSSLNQKSSRFYRANPIQFWILHPFLISIYPVLALYANNVDEAEFSAVIRPLFLCLLGAVIVLGLFTLLLRDKPRAALATSLCLVLFYSYGHIYSYLEN